MLILAPFTRWCEEFQDKIPRALPIATLPDHALIWIYGRDRNLSVSVKYCMTRNKKNITHWY